MSVRNATAPEKPNKPRPDFPLFPHATRRWAKKIRGKMHYFGLWDDVDGAEAKYLAERADLHAGRKPREVSAGVTIKDLANAFLNAKKALVESDELTDRSWRDYKATADVVVAHLGKGRLAADVGPDDFAALRAKMARWWGPVALGNAIQRVRSVFKFAAEVGLIDRPVIYGQRCQEVAERSATPDPADHLVLKDCADELRRVAGELELAEGLGLKARNLGTTPADKRWISITTGPRRLWPRFLKEGMPNLADHLDKHVDFGRPSVSAAPPPGTACRDVSG